MKTKVKKCSIFFEKHFQEWLNRQKSHEVRKAFVGVKFALEFAKAITWMCLTGQELWDFEESNPTLPLHPALRSRHKLFLIGCSESEMLLGLIRYSTRVEIEIRFGAKNSVEAEATFFQKGRIVLGQEEIIYDIATGQCRGFKGYFTSSFMDLTTL